MARPVKATTEAIKEFKATIAFVEDVLKDVPGFIEFLKGPAKPHLEGLHARLIWFYLRKNNQYVKFWESSKTLRGKARWMAAQQWGMSELVDPKRFEIDDSIIFRKTYPTIIGYKNPKDKMEKLIQKIASGTKENARKRADGRYTEILIPLDCPQKAVEQFLEKHLYSKAESNKASLNRNEVDNLLLNIPCAYSIGVSEADVEIEKLMKKFGVKTKDLSEFIKSRKKRFKDIANNSPQIFLHH